MDETVIVIMLKDETTGFLEKELDSYTLAENSELIFSIYAEGRDEKTVTLRLTCGRTLEDWGYEAVYDYYDMEPVGALVEEIAEEDGHYEPVWAVRLPFEPEREKMEEKLCAILDAHNAELLSVYEAIRDKEDDYRAE